MNKYLTRVIRNVGNPRPVMVFAVSVMHNSVVANFRAAGRPSHKWVPLKASTKKQRLREGTFGQGNPLSQPILMRFGTLFQSFQSGSKNNFTKVTPKSAEFGTILIKARGLQFGLPDKNVPPRPFLYWRPEDEKKIMSFMYTFAFNPGRAKAFGVVPTVGTIPKNLFMGVG